MRESIDLLMRYSIKGKKLEWLHEAWLRLYPTFRAALRAMYLAGKVLNISLPDKP
jgi:hypothetical protein